MGFNEKPGPKAILFRDLKMKATPLENKIAELARPAAHDLGLEIVCVKIIGEGGSRNVQIMAENPQTRNLGVEDCAKLSKSVSVLLDVEDVIPGAYRLEVSSPGIDRPLVRLEDFETYKGLEARLETDGPVDASRQKKFKGILKGLKGNAIVIDTEQGTAEIPFDMLNKAKLVLTDQLIKTTATN